MTKTPPSFWHDLSSVPPELRTLKQWVLWRNEDGRKVPYQVNGFRASSTNPNQWASFDDVAKNTNPKNYSGVGFVFTKDDSYIGIDLDDCRDKDTGEIADWAQRLIDRFASYTEVSPSGTGAKLWVKGSLPGDGSGKKSDYESGAVEIYTYGRYFTVTGESIGPSEVREAQEAIDETWAEVFGNASTRAQLPLTEGPETSYSDRQIEGCKEALEKLPDAMSGQGGHDATLRAACTIRRHHINGDQGYKLLEWFNATKCSPSWEDHELRHKWDDSLKKEPNASSEFGAAENGGEIKRRIKVITSAELATGDYENRYLIDKVLVERQPAILAAYAKGGKTTLAVAASVAVALGEPFLNKFEIDRPRNTLVMSGESGLGTLQETGKRIAKSYGRELEDIKSLYWSEDLPQLDSDKLLCELGAYIDELKIEFLIVDPLYLAMPGVDANNLIVMGGYLRNIAEVCQPRKVTPLLVHHLKKTRTASNGALSLQDIAWSGFSEFARQWWLLDRTKPFAGGIHNLRLFVGGSAGHHGQWDLEIDEGRPDDILSERTWDVSMVDASALESQAKEAGQSNTAKKVAESVVRELELLGKPETKNGLRTLVGRNASDLGKGLESLLEAGRITRTKFRKGKKMVDGYTLTKEGYPDKADDPDGLILVGAD